jgi:hypothetical protein
LKIDAAAISSGRKAGGKTAIEKVCSPVLSELSGNFPFSAAERKNIRKADIMYVDPKKMRQRGRTYVPSIP